MALAVEAALTAAELADLGWRRLTGGKSKAQRKEEKAALEQHALELEGELAKERVETKKLQAALEEYKHLLMKLHEERGMVLGSTWLDDDVTTELIEGVEKKVNSPAFLDHLMAPPDATFIREGHVSPESQHQQQGCTSGASSSRCGSLKEGKGDADGGERDASTTRVICSGGIMEVCIDSEDESGECWQWVTAREMCGGVTATSEPCSILEGEEDYEIVEGEDVVEGLALVLARFITSHPDYKGLSSEDLKKAMAAGFKDLRGKGVLRALWDWSKFVYKASRWATAAYGVYRHPLMIRAILVALVSSTRIILGMAVG